MQTISNALSSAANTVSSLTGTKPKGKAGSLLADEQSPEVNFGDKNLAVNNADDSAYQKMKEHARANALNGSFSEGGKRMAQQVTEAVSGAVKAVSSSHTGLRVPLAQSEIDSNDATKLGPDYSDEQLANKGTYTPPVTPTTSRSTTPSTEGEV